MAILSTNQRLINVGDSYSAGNGIKIENNIISVTDDNAPYSAGQNIYFDGDDNHVINGKDWGSEINDASANAYNVTTAWVQDNYANSADMTYISAMVDTKLDTSAWSSVSGDLATESYAIMADNITYDRARGYVDSKDFATKEFVNENTSGKLDSTAFDTWRNGQYSTDLQTIEGQISNKLDSSSFIDVSGTFYPTTNPSSFVNEDWVTAQGYITGVDLSEYAKRTDVLSSIESATSGKLDVSSFASVSSDFLTTSFGIPESATWNETSNVVQTNSGEIDDAVTTYQTNSSTYLTAHQSLDGLMSASLLESADGKWTAYNSIPFKAGDEFPASADEAIQCVQSNSSNWQSVTNKLDSDVFTAWSANQASNNYQLSAGDGISIIDDDVNKITRIDVTAGGGDMFTAYLEYNDQNQISGYAGSAIAGQGGTTYTSPSGTILINGDTLEGTNSAISIVGYEGFVSSYGLRPVGPTDTATYTWDKALPTNIITLDTWATHHTLYWSANTDLTGEIILPEAGRTTQSISIPNATAFEAWSDNYFNLNFATVSAAGTLETVVGELAWASALPTYEYDDTNKISAINGSAIAGGGGGGNPEVENYVQTNSGTIDDTVTSYQTNSGTFLTAHQAISANEWNGCYDNVNTNSGAWGGSALPISAGPGVKLQLVNNTLVFSNDETVLFENNKGVTGGTLNEAAWNFNKIGIQITGSLNSNQYFEEIPLSGKTLCFMSTIGADASYHFTPSIMYIDNNDTFSFSSFDYYTSTAGSDNTLYKNSSGHLKVVKVIGINRK